MGYGKIYASDSGCLRNSPALPAVAVLSLALGIGANSTIFSVINAFVYRPLPFKDPDRLVVTRERVISERGQSFRHPKYSTVLQLRNQSGSLESVGLVSLGADQVTLAGVGEADRVEIQYVDSGLFSVLGVEPALGRGFLPNEGGYGQEAVVIISRDLWQSTFDGDVQVIGKTARIDGEVCTIVGVMPPGFWIVPWESTVDVWRVINLAANPDSRWLTPIGRLKPGVTVDQARAETALASARASKAESQAGIKVGGRVDTLQEDMLGQTRGRLYFLLGTSSNG